MDTRKLIIESAFVSFIDHGYDRVSLNQIIKSTGLTKGAFYHHFSSKDELIKEVLHTYFFSHLQKTIKFVENEGQSFDERMNMVFRNVISVEVTLDSQPNRIVERNDFLKLFWDSMSLNTLMLEMNQVFQERIIDVMQGVINQGKEEGTLKKEIVSLEIAQVIAATVRGTIMMTSHLDKEASEQVLRTNINAIMKLIRV